MMTITDISSMERIKTAEFAFREFRATATLDEGADAVECAKKLNNFVRESLGVKSVQRPITPTKPQSEAPKSKEVKGEDKPVEPKKPAKKAAKKTTKKKVVSEVLPTATKEDVQNAMRATAKHFGSAPKAVALLEEVTGCKTVAEVKEEDYAKLVKRCKEVTNV